MLSITGAMGQTTSGDLAGTEVWSGTVTVTGDVVITGSLTIEPGTAVRFATSNDNIVMGSSDKIYLVVMPAGALQANGTAGNRISFSSTSPLPVSGAWGKIRIIANGSKSRVSFCDFEYHDNVVAVEKPAGVTGTSNFTLTNCTFTNGGTCAFASDGDSLTVDSCFFDRNQMGVFHHGAGYVGIFNSIMYRSSSGFVNAGKAEFTSSVEVDHLTLYDMDISLAGTAPRWWDGYGIFCTNDGYAMSLTNSILYQSSLANLVAGNWTVTENNNCFHTGAMGLANYEDGTVNTAGGSFEGDPMFDDAPGSFALDALSSCVGTAGDGGNMGAPAGVAAAGIGGTGGQTMLDGVMLPAVPVAGKAVFSGVPSGTRLDVFDAGGNRIAGVAATGSRVVWDRNGVSNGTYLYRLSYGSQARYGSLIAAD